MKKKTSTHGGKRKNAGRKQKEPTVIMRVPKSLEAKFKALIEKHKLWNKKTVIKRKLI